MVKSEKPKRKKRREHPFVTAIRKVYEDQIGIRELCIEEMYMTNMDMDEKRRPQEYIR